MSSPDTGVMKLRIATFNIRNGRALDGSHSWPFRRKAVVQTIESFDADIVGLQEGFHFQRKFLARKLPEYRFFGEGRSGGVRGEGCPILSRPRFVAQDGWTRWLSESGTPGSKYREAQFPRIATAQKYLDQETGQQFQIINTHLDAKNPVLRLRSVEKLLSWVEDLPALIIGDLNCGFEELAVFDLFAASGFEAHSVGVDTSPGFARRPQKGRPQIDHIVSSCHWSVETIEAVDSPGRPASDHLPLIADLLLT